MSDARRGIKKGSFYFLAVFVPFLVAVLLYAPTLRLPLVYDTLLHTQLADGLDWRTVWLPSDQFGFYRPLVFAPMLLIEQLFGGYPAWLLHGLNVGQHALNALLLAALVWPLTPALSLRERELVPLSRGRGVRGEGLALLSGLLLATFPFAYQAVISYGNNAYLTATGAVLLGLLVHERVRPAWWRLALVALIFVVGVLVHETAVLLIPLIFLKQVVIQGARCKVQGIKPFTIHYSPFTTHNFSLVLLLIAYLLIYFSLDTGGGPLLDYGGNDPWVKLLLFAQTAAWPWAWLAHRFPNVSAQVVILSSTAVTLFLTLFILIRQPAHRPLLLFGWGWWLGASLLIALTLPTYYIADGARLLYPGAPGLALVWGVVVVALGQEVGRHTRPWIAPVVTASLALLLMWQGATFVRGMIDSYEMASAPTTAVVEHFATQAPTADDHGIILVNWPQWLAPPRNTFALGTEFAPVLGDHLFAAELLRVNVGQNGVERPVYNLVVPDLLRETPYHYGVYQFTAVDQLPPPTSTTPQQVFITDYTDSGPVARHTGQLARQSAPSALVVTLGPWQLYRWQACLTANGDRVQTSLTLTLPDPAALPPTASFFVQLLGTDGSLLAQADGPALGLAPERFADLEGVVLVDRRVLAVPAGAEPGVVLVGVYDYVSGERLPVFGLDNTAVVNNALQVAVTECQ